MILTLILVLFFGLIFLGVPIAYSMIVTSIAYFIFNPIPGLIDLIPQKMFEGVDFVVLTAIPFFLLAGEIMTRSGMAERLVHFSNLVIGKVRGGFAYVNVLASLMFSGITGVAVGDIAALGKVEVHGMEKMGYPRPFAAAVTVASALVGPIIPPSTIIILYAAVMNVSIGGMFLAALIPGVLMAVADMLVIYVQAKRRNFPIPDIDRSLPAFVSGTRDAALALLMPIFLIGGIVGGIMTPTEAAAATVGYALFVSVIVYRGLRLKDIVRIVTNSGYESARLLFMIGAATTMTWIFALEDFGGTISSLFVYLDGSTWQVILGINLLFIVLGMFMDAGIALILFGPLVAPLAYAVGVHPLQLGIMLVVNVTIGLATPPIGNALFAISSIVHVPMGALIRELLPFLALKFVLLLLIGLVPAVSMAIPRYFGF